jgi:hypothetical protein
MPFEQDLLEKSPKMPMAHAASNHMNVFPY